MDYIDSEKKVYILLNKPKNFTTAMDEGQNTVCIGGKSSTTAKIGAVGRMDKNTTGCCCSRTIQI
jgi:23S rRNA pseudouridine2605 synthase